MSRRLLGATSADRSLAQDLRSGLLERRFGDDEQLPTEAQLAAGHGVSRQTVRRAMQDLVAEGLIYRVPGRGTLPIRNEDRYLRQFGSIEDLMGLSLDTRLELVVPLQRRVDPETAQRLRLVSDVVMSAEFRRLHEGAPLCFTVVHLPPDVAQVLQDVPELHTVGARGSFTVLGLLDARLGGPVVEAEQAITIAPSPDPRSPRPQPPLWGWRRDSRCCG